jgi:hypothetical protein
VIVFRDFISFLKNSNFGNQLEIGSIFSFLKLVFVSFIILFLIDIIVGLGISTPLRYFNLFPSQKDYNFTTFNIIKISLLLPIIEELIFRLPLRISKVNFAIPLCIILFLILYKLNIYIAISLSLVLFVVMLIGIKKESDILNFAGIFYKKYFWFLFYFQALIFGFLHLTNYNLEYNYFYLFPFFIISYIITGSFFGYLRIRYKYGIYLCIVSHIVVNSIYSLVLFR